MKKKYELTEEHRAQLKPWADLWIERAMSTKAMDAEERSIMVTAVNGMYAAANLPLPKNIAFVASPLQLSFAGGFAAAVCYLRQQGNKPKESVKSSKPLSVMAEGTLAAVRQAVDGTKPTPKKNADMSEPNWREVAAACAAEFGYPAETQFFLDCANRSYNMWNGGNQWAGYPAHISFFRHVAKLDLPEYEKWQHYENGAIHGGPRIMHAEFCIVSDRPEILKVDDENRPHCDDGPSHRWRDGWELYYIHGVRVTKQIVVSPETLTAQQIEAEENAEVRRIMIDRFGQDKYIIQSGAKKIHVDDWGTLWRKELTDDEPLVMVELINSTPEFDGTNKTYFLRVDPQLRPIFNGGIVGEPQDLTALNAVASTFGMTGKQYQAFIGNYEELGLGAAQS